MEPIRLTIFHTNDMHGHLDEAARLSGFARRLRAAEAASGNKVFFWDAGDAADRTLRFCSISKGAAYPQILNAMGYTLQTMGNDIGLVYGPQAMTPVAARSDFPILAANCRNGADPLIEGLQERVLIPIDERLTMGVFGLTAPWNGMYEVFGLRFPDFIELAQKIVARMKTEGVAPIILLSHLGLEDDRRVAESVPDIDLIIGAHSHDKLPQGEEHDGVLIAQAGQFAEALGRITLTLDPQTGKVLSRSAKVLDIPEDEPPDPAVLEAIEAAEKEAEILMQQPIGTLTTALDLDHFGECSIGNLGADALLERMGAEVSVVSSGMFHQGVPAGMLTLGALDAACFATANPCLTRVRGEQILAALERGLDPELTEFKHPGFRGTPIGTPQIGGMTVEYDPTAEVGQKIKRVKIQNQPLEPSRLYRLAHTDAETFDQIGYFKLDEDQETHHEVPAILREAIEDYLKAHDPVPEPQKGRWQAVSG